MKYEKTVEEQTIDSMEYYKNNIEEAPIDILRAMYKDLKENSIPREKIKEKKQWLVENILQNDYAYDRDKDIAEYQVNILDDILEE